MRDMHEINDDFKNVIMRYRSTRGLVEEALADLRPAWRVRGPGNSEQMRCAEGAQKTGATRRSAQSAAGAGCEPLTTAG